jgi:hypothetical protein
MVNNKPYIDPPQPTETITCPECGGDQFECGQLAFEWQPFYFGSDNELEWGVSKHLYEEDYPQEVRCFGCLTDLTHLFGSRIEFFGTPGRPQPKGSLPFDKAIGRIHALLDGQEWSPDTLDSVAEIIVEAGLEIRSCDVCTCTYPVGSNHAMDCPLGGIKGPTIAS